MFAEQGSLGKQLLGISKGNFCPSFLLVIHPYPTADFWRNLDAAWLELTPLDRTLGWFE
jgi:hypothetical protein